LKQRIVTPLAMETAKASMAKPIAITIIEKMSIFISCKIDAFFLTTILWQD